MRIHYLRTGDVQIKSRHQRARFAARPARMLDVLRDPEWSPRLPIGCWLIEHPEGLILVDTGESAHANDPGYQPWWHPFMRLCERRWVQPEEEVGSQLVARGFNLADVRWVVMTHMHGDHAGGVPSFPKSEFILSATEASAALARTGPLNGYLNKNYPAWFRPRRIEHADGAWESFAHSTKLTRDGRVRIVPTPGHTKGHQSVVVERSTHLVLIAGDASYNERAMLDGLVDGVAQDFAAHRDTTRRLRELCMRHPVVTQFAHDSASASRLEAETVTAIGP